MKTYASLHHAPTTKMLSTCQHSHMCPTRTCYKGVLRQLDYFTLKMIEIKFGIV